MSTDLSIVPAPDKEPDKGSGASELDFLLCGVKSESERRQISDNFYTFAKGDPQGFSVRFAMLLKALGNAIKNSVELLARECRGLSAVLIAYQTALKEAHSKGRAPELNPDQIETLKSELIAKLSKVVEKDNTLIIESLNQMPRLVAGQFSNLWEERIADHEKKDAARPVSPSRNLAPEKETEGAGWTAWAKKTRSVITNRGFIALTALVLGMLPGFFLAKHQSDLWFSESQKRIEETSNRLTAAINKLPEIVRHQITGDISFVPPADGNPGKLVIDLGQRLRPINAEVKPDGKVLVVLAP